MKKKADSTLVITETAKAAKEVHKGKKTVVQKEMKKTTLSQHNKEKLKEVGLWAFIEESQSRPWPDYHKVMTFFLTMDEPAVLKGKIDGKSVHFDNTQISAVLRIPGKVDGRQVKELDKLTRDELTAIFPNGLAARVQKRWCIESANLPWHEWFVFINTQFTFEQHQLEMSAEAPHMAIASWKGERLDWAGFLDQQMRRLLWAKPGIVPENHELQCYLSMLCRAYNEACTSRPLTTSSSPAPVLAAPKRTVQKRRRTPNSDEATQRAIVKRVAKPAELALAGEALTANEREELENRIATEASKVTELEDRVQDLLAQSDRQVELLEKQQQNIEDLTKTIDDRTTMCQAMRLTRRGRKRC